MLKFHFKKFRLNFMLEWQSALVEDDEEDWLRRLADATNAADRAEAMAALTKSFEMGDTEMQMPEGEMNT